MNDDDFAKALAQHLEDLTADLTAARHERERGRKLLEHLQAEHQSLRQQKEQRQMRQELALTVTLLQKQLLQQQVLLKQK